MNSTIFYHLSPYFFFFFLMIPRPPRSTLFPYTSSSDLWKDPWKRQKIETLALLLKGALEAEAKVGLKMNIAQKRSEEHTSELQSQSNLVCRLLLEKKKIKKNILCKERNKI